MEAHEIKDKIEDAEMVLVGIGEDFGDKRLLLSDVRYISGCEVLKQAGCGWLLPAWDEFCSRKRENAQEREMLEKLAVQLKDKNYFVVSTSLNSQIACISWKHNRLVMPCGSSVKKQCKCGCEGIMEVTGGEWNNLQSVFEKLYGCGILENEEAVLGECKKCGGALIFNNIYAEKYREEGYLNDWELYMKWLQGTLNHKLLLLELGVGMKYPSVIRWPFEKVAYFNQKAFFCRIHDTLYQLPPELSEKGCGISQNAIDWLKLL